MIAKTKFYITVNKRSVGDNSICYFFHSKGFWVNSLVKIGEYNYIAIVEYENENEVNKLTGNYKVRSLNLQVRRIFKLARIIKIHGGEPNRSFLNSIIILASARIKDVNIKIISKTDEAGKWKKQLIKQWQEELDHPKKFKELGITPKMNIAPDGKLRLHLNVVGKYVIVYFEDDISKYYDSVKRI